MHIPDNSLYPVLAAMEQWTDKRVIDDVDLQNLLLFLLCVPKALSQNGTNLKGFSCRQKNNQTLLTVKGWEGETPLVVFITSATPIGCMGRFLALMEDDRLTWVKDRYPWT